MSRNSTLTGLVVVIGVVLGACTTTRPETSTANDLDRDLTAVPSVDQMGLDTGVNTKQWEEYRTTVPFQTEARESTSVEALGANSGKNKSRTRYVAQRSRRR